MRVLLAADGSPQSLKAADWVWRLNRIYPDLHCIILCVVARPTYWKDAEFLEGSMEAWAEAVLHQAADAVELPPEQITRLMLPGVPAEVICKIAREEKCGLICMGATGANLFLEILLGSTTHRVLEICSCPVFVAR